MRACATPTPRSKAHSRQKRLATVNQNDANSARKCRRRSVGVVLKGERKLSLSTSSSANSTRGRSYRFWPALPLFPRGGERRTLLRRESSRVYTLDQYFGVLYVLVPIRMTILVCDDCGPLRGNRRGLCVYSPIAPTDECVALVRDIERKENCFVEHIVSSSAQGAEHKQYVGPFARRFASSAPQVWIAPSSWSLPNLPQTWLGLPANWRELRGNDHDEQRGGSSRQESHPLGPEIRVLTLGPIELDAGPFCEITLYHKPSRTLIVTDACVNVPRAPPPILADTTEGRKALLFHARDANGDVLRDTPRTRAEGWAKIALFSLYFRPSALDILGPVDAFVEAFRYDGLFPWKWQADGGWKASFRSVVRRRLLVAPILQTLVLSRDRAAVARWLDACAQIDFRRVLSQHYTGTVEANIVDLLDAFSFITMDSSDVSGKSGAAVNLPEQDMALLVNLSKSINPPQAQPFHASSSSSDAYTNTYK